MRRAYCLIRNQPHYRIDAFSKGLEKSGYYVIRNHPVSCKPGDLLLIWNRYGINEVIADKWSREGGIVIVCENGYIGTDSQSRQYYAIALNGHNGSGNWHVGSDDRWQNLNVPINPWRESGSHILICAQRGIGSKTMASPPGWEKEMAKRLSRITRREIKIRRHPQTKDAPVLPLSHDLENAWATVVWSSTAAVKSLLAGIPVFYDAPHMIVSGAACNDITQIEIPKMGDRIPALQRMAWAQWSIEEIEMGLPFSYLLKNETDILLPA